MTIIPLTHFQQLINREYAILNSSGTLKKDTSMMAKIVNATHIVLNNDNYLPWIPEYACASNRIDGITSYDLKDRKWVWGYDPENRPFIAFQYLIIREDETCKEECSILFQSNPHSPNLVEQGGLPEYRIGIVDDKKLAELAALFQNKVVACDHLIVVADGACVEVPYWVTMQDNPPLLADLKQIKEMMKTLNIWQVY